MQRDKQKTKQTKTKTKLKNETKKRNATRNTYGGTGVLEAAPEDLGVGRVTQEYQQPPARERDRLHCGLAQATRHYTCERNTAASQPVCTLGQ